MQRERLLCISQETAGNKAGGRADGGSVAGETGIVSLLLPLIAPLQC